MYLCSAKCCNNDTAGMDSVQRCLTNCSTPIERVQSFIQSEMEGFQVRQLKVQFIKYFSLVSMSYTLLLLLLPIIRRAHSGASSRMKNI